jgi:MSHA biogenesis protein MshK
MAQSVKSRMNTACLYHAVLVVAGLLAVPAFGENLPDPTRPSGAAYADENMGNTHSGPVLQSVLTSAGRKLAIINGQTVKQGDMIGNARVARIGEGEVVLVQGKGTQVLKLFPVLEKEPIAGRPKSKNGMQ